uniref:Protein TIFY n=1 Tax=Camellia sinensis var. sinensis TaxID=542762 RepID=A0A1P8YYH2_CAMSN|nr:jasmonate-zim-domain protein 1 [Camellia sinensis var. sinensis]QEG58832.1 jasmonate ZIM-domain 5 [Camellia sinensis]
MSSSSGSADSGRFSGHRHSSRVPEKSASSSFSQTCSLLSQYLKEKKGTFGDLSLGMPTATTTMNLFPVAMKSSEVSRNGTPVTRNLTSMDLFPQQSGFGSNISVEESLNKVDSSAINKSEPETAQMTIFYAGQVIVFNDFPADKAKEIMLLASKGSSHHNPGTLASTPVQKPIEPTNLIPTSSASAIVPNSGNNTISIEPISLIPTTSSVAAPNFSNNMIQERVQVQRASQPIATDLPIARKASLTRFLEKRKDRITSRAPYQISSSTSPPKPTESKSWLGLAAQSPVQFEHRL